MNLFNYIKFYQAFFRKKIKVVHETPEGMKEGVLVRVSGKVPALSLDVSHIVNNGNSPKAQTTGNPANIFLLVPGGLQVSTKCKDKDGNVYYHSYTIPQMKVTGKDDKGNPIFENITPDWENS